MALKVYTLGDYEKWDEVVKSFNDYDTYWLSGYVKAFAIHGDGDPLLFYYEDGSTRGINVVMKRDVAKDIRFEGKIPVGLYFDFATPYGYGGWIIEGDATKNLFDTYLDWLKSNSIISEFVRFHPMIHNDLRCRSFYEVIQLGDVVHMDLSSTEIIWNNITSKNRNMIRKAKKNNVVILNGKSSELYKYFKEIYNGTMDKDKADEYYYFSDEFYKSILIDLPDNALVFYAVKDNIIISAAIILFANGKMNYHLSGSLREFSSLGSTNLLLYEVAIWGLTNGYKTLYLGGGLGSGEDSLFKFKRAFYRGELNKFYIGKRVIDTAKYDELVDMRGLINSEFFPKYRA